MNSEFKVENPIRYVWSWSYIRDILAGKKDEKPQVLSVLCLTSRQIISTHNYWSQQKSYEEVLWDGGFNDFGLQFKLPWRKGTGTKQLG